MIEEKNEMHICQGYRDSTMDLKPILSPKFMCMLKSAFGN